mgnify:CR=1 FL=1
MVLLSLLLSAAIFGFFYAWVCSTMWGLDATDPRTAIAAMQAMNGSVRNAIFAPAFFGTPVVMAATAWVMRQAGHNTSAQLMGLGAAVYFCFGLLLTMGINVPMNEALGALTVPEAQDQAREIWQAYSGKWQMWNQTRTIASGVAFLLAVCAVLRLPAR